MFVGHYAAAMAAKAAEPRAPLWTYVIGCQLLDVGWGVLVITGVERFRVDPDLPGSPLDLYFMPFTHSLPGALLWSAVAALAAWGLLRLPRRAAAMLALVVFSHWALDLIVHRPDLDLGDGAKVGLSLWNWPVPEMALEMGLVAVAGAAWTARVKAAGGQAWRSILFIGLMPPLAIVAMLALSPVSPLVIGAMALAVYLVMGLVSLGFDQPAPARSER